MKKTMTFVTLITLLFCVFNLKVSASIKYNQGLVKKSSTIYKEPNTSGGTVKSDTNGTITLYSPEVFEIIGESGNYYKIKFMYSGFVYEGYINKNNVTSTVYETDDSYEQSLIEVGFPEDYAKKLSILHAIHPNWSFAPSFTNKKTGGMDFYTAVNGEADVIQRNLISGSNTALRSTADGAYKNGTWISLSGSGWYAASKQTIAFFLDPRNFLDEEHIFMFENLGYNETTQTSEVVGKVLGSTFMNNPFECLEGAYICELGSHTFIDTFMETGKAKKVSPVHLASRVVQEQGSKGSVLSLGKGYNGEYVGYYNFFNIAASGITDYDVITNGLKYAMNRNWNNQRASIYEGADLIASNYIGRGQSTLYYQKFNTIASPIYGNQYMQNVKAPYSESYTTYTSYFRSYETQEEWNNGFYDFLIPVYSNMKDETTLDTSFNGDATLKKLEITDCKLNPDFQSSAYNYDCYVKNDVISVTISAETTNALAKLSNPGTVLLSSDEVVTTVKVTAINGTEANYTITIHKIETDGYTPIEVLNGVGIKVDENIVHNIEVGSDVSNIVNSVKNKYHFAEIKIMDANNKEKPQGIAMTGDQIIITNSGTTLNAKIVIFGDTSGDGLIDIRDLLIVQKHLVQSKTISDEYYRAADINKDGILDIRDLLLEQKYLLKAYSISQG